MTGRSAVFLDLQGTLGGEGFGDIRDFAFFPCAVTAIRLLNDAGLPAIVVTNQSRIARGLYTVEYFQDWMEALKQELAGGGAWFDAVYFCPHVDEDNCSCKKPKPGMLLEAQRDFNLDINSCYLVGDVGAWEMVLANQVGCKGVLVRTGMGESSLGEYRHTWADIEPHFIAEDVLDAVRWILDDYTETGVIPGGKL